MANERYNVVGDLCRCRRYDSCGIECDESAVLSETLKNKYGYGGIICRVLRIRLAMEK